MEVHPVQDRTPFPVWDSGAGLQKEERREDRNQKGLKGQRRILSRAMTQSNELRNDTSACCGAEGERSSGGKCHQSLGA